MSERDGYAPGVPCWIDTWRAEPETALDFYTELLGWDAEQTTPPGPPVTYFLGRLRGRDVAAIGSPPPDSAPSAPGWTTYVWVESADGTAAAVTGAGGTVVMEPSDSLDGGRVAIVADPAGAVLGVWQPGAHKGAQLVNEPGAWSMSALNTRDPDGAKAFYGAVLGWQADTMDLDGSEFTLFRLPGYVGGEPEQPVPRDVIATMAPAGDADVPPHWSVDFWVGDVEGTVGKAAELGGSVVVPAYDIPGTPLRQGVLADPEGVTFSVTEIQV
jgi:predicted enzyme related to lactoylglutathione lyase